MADKLHPHSKDIISEIDTDVSFYNMSRYRKIKTLKDKDGNYYLATLYPEDMYIPESDTDSWHQVTAGEEGRLDLIAYLYYNTPDLYWVIAYANDIDDPFDVKAGTILRIPSIQSLYGIGGILA